MKHLQTPLRFLAISPVELSLRATLKCGQAFRWTERPATDLTDDGDGVEWLCSGAGRTLVLRQDARGIHYRALYPLEASQAHSDDVARDTTRSLLERYLNIEVDLARLVAKWEKTDRNFAKKTQGGRYTGIRVLRQEPWETLISFICSSNNNIGRITLMLTRLCAEYGTPLPLGQFSFPTPERLKDEVVADRLRELGFGYRAPWVVLAAQRVLEDRATGQTLDEIAHLPEAQQRERLLLLDGVGPKVADCIRLFGLGQNHVVPVDVHIARLAQRDYGVKVKEGSKEMHAIVQKALGAKWGDFSGWTQQILFSAELGNKFASTDAEADTVALGKKRKIEEEAYPTPAPTPARKAAALAMELVEVMHPKEGPIELSTSPAERSKSRGRRKKIKLE